MMEKANWKPLTESDLPELQAFCEANEEYYSYIECTPDLESLRQQLVALPPQTTMEQKYFMGLWEAGRLMAILDLILDWPQTGTAYIGWFMVARALQRNGVGKHLIKGITDGLTERDYKRVRLGCVEDNLPGMKFWQACGFVLTGEVADSGAYKVILLEKAL